MKNFKISLLFSALFVSALFLTSMSQIEQPCTVEQPTVSQDTAQFLEYYGSTLIYDDYNEKLPVRMVKDAAKEYVNYTTNLDINARLHKMSCNNQDFIVCIVIHDSSYEILASYINYPPAAEVRENFGYFTSESDFLIHPCAGEHKIMHINYASFNFNNIQDSSFREYCKSLKQFEALIEATDEPYKHIVCFGGVDNQGVEHYFTTFIIRT